MFTFGKFKQQPIQDVFQQNYYYIDWITKQSWFQTKFKDQYTECVRLLEQRKHKQQNQTHNTMILLSIQMVLVEKMEHLKQEQV